MTLDAVFVNGVLISFVSEEIIRMTVAHREKRRGFVPGAERIGDGGGQCGGLLKLGFQLWGGIASSLAVQAKRQAKRGNKLKSTYKHIR